MHMSMVFPIFELKNGSYSVPVGSFGYIQKADDMKDDWCFIHWLPPQSGGSGPILNSDLEVTGNSISIPHETLEEMGWRKS